jgi:DNA-3-methyladenine glycosylase
MECLQQDFFKRPVTEVARDLIGCRLLFKGVGGIITETESYSIDDEASHSFGGLSFRNATMFGPAGHAYVYRSYGIHWCLNAVCGYGSAVLIRALEPQIGLGQMFQRRRVTDLRLLCAGPGRLCQALDIEGSHNGLSITIKPFELRKGKRDISVLVGKRIGINKAFERPLRFGFGDSEFLSRKF